MSKIHPVVLAGGVGSRLWPLSRPERPKQFLPLVGPRTLLQDTLLRLQDPALFAPATVIVHERYAAEAAAQCAAVGVELEALVLEPAPRSSGPPVAVAALRAAAADPNRLAMILPADHLIQDPAAFRAATARAAEVARAGLLTTFGIEATRPETGYGYIRAGAAVPGTAGRVVDAFVEKPDRETAEAYVASGAYFWNSGMFLFRAQDMVVEFSRHAPEMLAAAEAALLRARAVDGGLLLDAEAFGRAPSRSIDYAVMEKTDRAAVAPGAFPWSDIGAWDTVADMAAAAPDAPETADADGNVAVGRTALIETQGVYARGEGIFVAAIGVEDLVIVATPDAVLVTRKASSQKVREAADAHADALAAGSEEEEGRGGA